MIVISPHNTDVKDAVMSHAPLTTYILSMVSLHGTRTREVLRGYGRSCKEIQEAFNAAVKEGYLAHSAKPHQPYLTSEGQSHLCSYYGNDINGYD